MLSHPDHNFSKSQTTRKSCVVTDRGVVAAQHRQAAEVGAEVLRAGGDAVDAAVAVSYAIGVLEPWMSGPASGGAMMIWRADEAKAYALNYGMRAPIELDPREYPLEAEGRSSDLFPWRAVVEDRNVQGATAVAVPGTVAGTAEAHLKFGRLPWAALLEPAVKLATKGLSVDWYASLLIASCAKSLSKDCDAARLFLDEGTWTKISGWTATSTLRLDQSRMADTLSRLAEKGASDFYMGEIAHSLVADVRNKGGSLSLKDMSEYKAEWQPALRIPYRGARIWSTPTMTAGPTMKETMEALEASFVPSTSRPTADHYIAYATALQTAYTRRLSQMGDGESESAPACTTHFSVVDRHGNMVAMTQTLLSMFGSRVVSPGTGLLLNNGVMWFDPEQGKPNSLGPGKRCLMNICPVIVEEKERLAAIGASGGRKILPAVTQLASFLVDFGMGLEDAFHHPRIDVSKVDSIIADEALGGDMLAALARRFDVHATPRTLFPYAFACPAGVLSGRGLQTGCTEIMSPWGDAISE